jgi:hypothetical protein
MTREGLMDANEELKRVREDLYSVRLAIRYRKAALAGRIERTEAELVELNERLSLLEAEQNELISKQEERKE